MVSGFTSTLLDWVVNPLLWLFLVFLFVGATMLFLRIRKKRKLIYPALEVVDLGGNGKVGFNTLKCGWFGKNKYLRGWYDTGDEQLETEDGEVIRYFSTEDFQEVNGKRGVAFYRHPTDQDILLPISKLDVGNKELAAEIADASYRDAAVDIIRDADEETSDRAMKIMELVVIGIIVVFALLSIIFIVQMVKNSQVEAKELILDSKGVCEAKCREIFQTLAKPSTAP